MTKNDILFSNKRAMGVQLTSDRIIAEITQAVKAIEVEADELGVDIEWDSVLLSVEEGDVRLYSKYGERELRVSVVAYNKKEEQ